MTVATAAAALLCVLIAFFIQDLRLVKQVKAEQIATQLSMLTGNLAHALTQSDLKTVNYLLKNATSEHGIISSVVYDRTGKSLARYSQHDDAFNSIASPERFSFSVLPYTRSITWQGKRVGSLVVDVSYSDVEMRVLYLMGYSALAFLFAMGIAAVVARVIQGQVSEPILRLHRLSQDILETGNYSLRVEVNGKDELGQLGDAFNRMLSQIESRDLMMEKRVNQRTRELQKLAEDFRYRALHDSLTGLPNRAFLNEEFKRAVAHAKRGGKRFAVLMLDLDNFKTINDSLGHLVGDDLLKLVATKIRSALRAEDIVCRLGGDEFIVLLEGMQDIDQVRTVAEGCLFTALKSEISLAGRPFEIGVSIGASIYPQHGVDMTELKRNADVAMYRAKAAGKNRLVIYDPSLDNKNVNKSAIQNDLTHAVARKELILDYQPQINTDGDTIVGCEVFVRWQHQNYGLMLPGDFIPFAEDNGAIKKIDYFVIREACEQCKTWLADLDLSIPVSVNVSMVHFRSNELVEEVREILNQTGLPAHMLTLEFTESALLDESSTADNVVGSIRKMGVKVALDGFGVGYCSLAHLGSLRIDSIKLDHSLFRRIVCDGNERRLTKSLLAFARELGVSLIAEGVEQREQVPVLNNLGCPIVQGYAYSKPVSKDEFLKWVEKFQLNKPAIEAIAPTSVNDSEA